MTASLEDLTLETFLAARERIRDLVVATPLLTHDAGRGIYLKPESLQPVGSFKIRCAANAVLRRAPRHGQTVTTASAGNFAQGLAFAGRELGVPVTAYVPSTAAESKLDGLRRLGASVVVLPYPDWWRMLAEPSGDPYFIHPVVDPDVIAGNGTIGLELLEQLPDLAAVLVPYGGAGLSVGIAAALRAAGSSARVEAAESTAGAPLHAALAAGAPVEVDFDSGTFITGMGGPRVLDAMWPSAKRLIFRSNVVSLAEIAAAIRLLVERHHIVVEGAGGAPVAVALKRRDGGPVACVLSGGHLDTGHLRTILDGGVP